MRTSPATPVSTSCGRHPERPATAFCVDCGTVMCVPCAIHLEHLGTFCWSCAARRGGLHPRSRVHAARVSAEGPSEAIEPVAPPGRSSLSLQLFESMVADREPRPLISGLTERLEEAGADPEDVVDDDELIEDIGRLQELASTHPEHKGWRRRS